MSSYLYDINGAILELTEALENGEIDQQAYLDTVESLGAENAILDVVKHIRNLEAEAEEIKIEKMHLDSKQRRAESTVDKLRKILLEYMSLTNVDKMTAGVFNVTKGSTTGVELLYEDIENYPQEYLIEQKPKLDKRRLLTDLKNGCIVDGALLKNTEYIKIK